MGGRSRTFRAVDDYEALVRRNHALLVSKWGRQKLQDMGVTA